VGYTPAEHALRLDELENTVNIGAVPQRGVTQVRIHYLLDLVEVLGFTPSATTPSGWQLEYSWGALDFAIDWLVANNLSPGFELMGSPMGKSGKGRRGG
jgi:L-iduronidase